MPHSQPASTAPHTDKARRVRAEVARRVRQTNVAKVARDLGMSREQIARIAAGLDVREGTLLVALARLEAIGPLEAA